jgi:hypothetical protein
VSADRLHCRALASATSVTLVRLLRVENRLRWVQSLLNLVTRIFLLLLLFGQEL